MIWTLCGPTGRPTRMRGSPLVSAQCHGASSTMTWMCPMRGDTPRAFGANTGTIRRVRSGKTDEDEGLAAGISPVPRRIIHDDMDVPDAGRHTEGIWAEHRYDPEILGTILDKDHAVGEWFGQGRIDNDLRRGLRGRERYDAGRPEHLARGLSHGGGRVESSSPCYQGHESWFHR